PEKLQVARAPEDGVGEQIRTAKHGPGSILRLRASVASGPQVRLHELVAPLHGERDMVGPLVANLGQEVQNAAGRPTFHTGARVELRDAGGVPAKARTH